MKEFNLEEALAGKPVVTREGQDVDRIVYLPEISDPERKVLAIVNDDIEFFNVSGKYDEDGECDADLFMRSEKIKFYIVIPPIPENIIESSTFWTTHISTNEEILRDFDGRDRKIVEVEIDL